MGIRNRQYRNQTQLHEWLTKQSLYFLSNMATARGLIWRQEHTIHNGMRPDAIGFCSLQLQYGKMFKTNETWGDLMFVFETKISYSDFLNTFKGRGEYKEKPYANFHFLIIPKKFIETYDLSNLPDYWGILEPNRSALQIKKLPKYIEMDRLFFLEAAYTVLFKWQKSLYDIKQEIKK